MSENKRRFQRIPFDAHVTLTITEHPDQQLSGVLHDISLKGALLQVEDNGNLILQDQQGVLVITPDQGDIEITLTVVIAYALNSHNTFGVNIVSLDIDSAAHLRRLVEVNLGDEESLQRELSNLIDAMEEQHGI